MSTTTGVLGLLALGFRWAPDFGQQFRIQFFLVNVETDTINFLERLIYH